MARVMMTHRMMVLELAVSREVSNCVAIEEAAVETMDATMMSMASCGADGRARPDRRVDEATRHASAIVATKPRRSCAS